MEKKSCCGGGSCSGNAKCCEKDPVKEHYTKIAKEDTDQVLARQIALRSGYTEEDLKFIPPEAMLGQGCGNSVAAAQPKLGDCVLDIGCGSGMDLFLSGTKVGPEGKAIGVDFLEDMVSRGSALAKKYKRENVQFVYSPVECMPFMPNSFDIAISNCVLNLVPDKPKAFKEIHRVLKKGTGRFVVSDIVLKKPLPEDLANDIAAIVGCIGRAILADTYKKNLEDAGFKDVEVIDKKLDMQQLYADCTGSGYVCCGSQGSKLGVETIKKYNLNEYIMSCIVKAKA